MYNSVNASTTWIAKATVEAIYSGAGSLSSVCGHLEINEFRDTFPTSAGCLNGDIYGGI